MINISYTPPEIVEEIKKIDLLTYLKNYEPDELVRVGANTYTTKTHDSIRISNGLWNWFSRGIGGRSAVDYIKEDRNLSFKQAVDYIAEKTKIQKPIVYQSIEKKEKKELVLPIKNDNNNRVIYYLMKRKIDKEIIKECINNNLIYEEKGNHNVVFIGYDKNKIPKYAFCRATNDSRFMRDAEGSDKNYSFRLESLNNSNSVHLFESSIDLLSYATLMKIKNLDFNKENLLSVGGVYKAPKDIKNIKIPNTVKKYLEENSNIKNIYVHFDNDEIGREATKILEIILSKKYKVIDKPVPIGKDCNDYLCYISGIKNFIKNTKEKVR